MKQDFKLDGRQYQGIIVKYIKQKKEITKLIKHLFNNKILATPGPRTTALSLPALWQSIQKTNLVQETFKVNNNNVFYNHVFIFFLYLHFIKIL